MKVADFGAFVRLTALADLDPGAAQLGFRGKPRLLAWYQGQHLGAVTAAESAVTIKGLSGENASCAVDTVRLAAALRLFPDADAPLTVTFTPPDLTLSVPGMRLALRTIADSTPPQMGSKGADQMFTVAETDRALLSTALGILSDVSGTRPLKPVLAGTLASVKDGTLRLAATDAISAAIVEIPVEGADGDYGIIPIADLRAALATFGDEKLKVGLQGGRVDLTCGRTRIRLALFNDTFPDILAATPAKYAQIVELSAQAVATAAKAATVLGTTSQVILKARQGKIVLLVNTQEVGSFQTVGGAGALDCELTLGSSYLEKARAFGDTLKLHLNDAKSTIMIEGEHPGWRYWLAPISR
jgi:hypothetical protein